MCRLYDSCGFCHRVGFTAVDLDRHGSFFVMDGEFAGCGSNIADERIRVDEFRIDAVGAVAFA